MKNNIKKINAFIQSILAECQVDYESLWRIVKHVKEDGLATSPAEVRTITYDIVRTLLGKGMVAGNFHQKNPQVYNMSPDKIIAMIDHEWNKLNRDPNIGDIISFTDPSFLPVIMAG